MMNQIFISKKTIAVVLIGCFLFFMQSSLGMSMTGPDGEEQAVETQRAEDTPDSPGKIEVSPDSGKQAKKKHFPWLLAVAAAVGIGVVVYLLLSGKKVEVKVSMDPGVSGTPAVGTHKYRKGDIVNYSYSVQSGYKNLQVTLDGAAVPASGSFEVKGSHTLEARAAKIGRITGMTIRLDVRFAGTNLWFKNVTQVDNEIKINETITFDVHSSGGVYETAKKIDRSFSITKNGPGSIFIHQEADPNSWGVYYTTESYWIWGTEYTLTVTNYIFVDGVDPGTPLLSENHFYLNVAPFAGTMGDPASFSTVKDKTITVSQPQSLSALQRGPTARMATGGIKKER